MKKLSKAQQAVVDKMREGWELFFTSNYCITIRHYALRGYWPVWHATFKSLIKNGVIEPGEETTPQVYRLTKQYKTAGKYAPVTK